MSVVVMIELFILAACAGYAAWVYSRTVNGVLRKLMILQYTTWAVVCFLAALWRTLALLGTGHLPAYDIVLAVSLISLCGAMLLIARYLRSQR